MAARMARLVEAARKLWNSASPSERAGWAVRGVLALGVIYAAALPLIRLAGVIAARAGYPFDLEWMESGMITHVQVVLDGGPLYRMPSLEFTPFIYPPLYYWVSALSTLVGGVGHFALRFVSIVSTIACLVLLALWVYVETRDWLAGFVAAGMFASVFGATGFWFDLGRVDSLFLALALGGSLLARTTRTLAGGVSAGLLLAACVLTKQAGVFLIGPPLLYLFLCDRRRGIAAAAACFGALGLAFFLLNRTSGGWFWFYVFELPGQHEVNWKEWKTALRQYFWTPIPLLGMSGIAMLLGFGARAWRDWLLLAGWLVAAAAAGLSGMLHTGGYPNNLLPAYAALALAFGVVFAGARRLGGSFLIGRPGAELVALAAILLQVEHLSYDATKIVPTAEDRAATERSLEILSRAPQPIWVVSASYYAFKLGQQERATHAMGLTDVFKGNAGTVERFRGEIEEQIRARRYKSVVLDRAHGFLPGSLSHAIRENYTFQRRLFSGKAQGAGWPKVGASIRPDELWVAK
jgi:hypothetical protein